MKPHISYTLISACTLLLSSCADLVNQINTLSNLDSIGVGSVTFKPSAYHDPKLSLTKVDSVLGAFGTSSDQLLASQLKRYYPKVEQLTNLSPSHLVRNSLNNALQKDSFFGSRYSENPRTKINIEITSLGFNRENDGDPILDMALGLTGNVYVVGPTGKTAFQFSDVNGSSKLSTLLKAVSSSNIAQFRQEAASSFAQSIKNNLRTRY